MTQPAVKNYFFGKNWEDVFGLISLICSKIFSIIKVCLAVTGKVIAVTFMVLLETIKNSFKGIGSLIAWQWEGLCNIIEWFIDDCDVKQLGIMWTIMRVGFHIAMIIAISIFTTGITLMLTVTSFGLVILVSALVSLSEIALALTCIVTVGIISATILLVESIIMVIIIVIFSIVSFSDFIFRKSHSIVSHCSNCQRPIALPTYICPNCGVEHTHLAPSKYGIFKRKCKCGHKIPTTFFNGRQKLEGTCPHCGNMISKGGEHSSISIPVIGGPSSGKTCFINMAIREFDKFVSQKLNFKFIYEDEGNMLYEGNMIEMENGMIPQKTNDEQLTYYRFNFTPNGYKIPNLISLCDIAGEAYEHMDVLGAQVGFKYANGFLLIVDPLSIYDFKKETEANGIAIDEYKPSSMSIDQIASIVTAVLDNMNAGKSGTVVKKKIAVVITKCDFPGIEEKLGKDIINDKIATNNKLSILEARNIVCEEFLSEYGESDFVNIIKSKFSNYQYFTCSSLGHNVDGTNFTPTSVVEPVLWLINGQNSSLKISNKDIEELK
ncbi:MAG: hypothetical protein ACI35S_01080 [Anaeroplasma sp.]